MTFLYILLSCILSFFDNLVTIANAINAFLLIAAQKFIWDLYPVYSMEIFNNPQKNIKIADFYFYNISALQYYVVINLPMETVLIFLF